MNSTFLNTIPIMRIFDVVKAKDFYVGFLGFTIDWEHRFDNTSPAYLQISKGDLVLHLSEHHGDCCPGSTVFVWMKGIEDFHDTITSRGYGYMRPGIERTFYNSICVEVTDPFGNRIRFNEAQPKGSETCDERADSNNIPVAEDSGSACH
ncbi:MAG: VOC family protein [Planctomycetaceae bacterium]|nr:VOC family protein [Planctomycetaceae bacterium]